MFIVRPACPSDALGIATVHVETWQSTYRGFIPDDYLDSLSIKARRDFWDKVLREPPAFLHTFVAVNAKDEVLGFTRGGHNRDAKLDFDGEVMALYLLKAYQGQGIGRRLFQASIDRLIQDGFRSLILWVIEGSPTCQIYAHLGGQPIAEKFETIGGKEVKELGYAWHDLSTFATHKRIYHIADRAAWQDALSTGIYEHPSLSTEGFIHCSDRHQLVPVANRYFRGQTDLTVLDMDASKVKARLVYENTTGGTELFPHVYGSIHGDAVLVAHPFSCGPEGAFHQPP